MANAVRSGVAASALDSIAFVGLIGFRTDALDNTRKSEIAEKLESEYGALTMRKAYDKLHEELRHKQRPIRNNSYDGGYNRGGGGG